MASTQSFPRFACDSCRGKKTKCSRELPKCAACRPWPGSCVYSKDGTANIPQTVQSSPLPNLYDSTETPPISPIIEERLGRVEDALKRLAFSIRHSSSSSSNDNHQSNRAAKRPCTGEQLQSIPKGMEISAQSAQRLSDTLHSFAVIDETNQNLQEMRNIMDCGSNKSHHEAQRGLQELSEAVRPSSLHYDEKEMTAGIMKKDYFVPSKSVGYKFMGQLVEIMDLAQIISVKPTDSTLQAAVFQPEKVEKPGWLIWTNLLLLNLHAVDSGHASLSLISGLKRNIKLALNDARVFLEPDQVNLQAFMLLASHGESYATPGFSWMFMGHACRQAQAISLHKPKQANEEDRQRQLSLFWGLFAMDKTCSLAFGRPPLLASTAYGDVPLPDFCFLQKYQSHNPDEPVSRESTFGAHYFYQMIDLAKVAGHVLDFLSGANPMFDRDTLVCKVAEWGSRTKQILNHARNSEISSATEHQAREMSIGIKTMDFQHLHVLLLLLPGTGCYAAQKLETARKMLNLLAGLVSDPSQVFNGIVWQLLYYPFAAFFAVFNNVTREPALSTVDADLQLLKATASYFRDMKHELGSRSDVSAKLEETAFVFHKLAAFIVETFRTSGDSEASAKDSQRGTDEPVSSWHGQEIDIFSYSHPFTAFLQAQHEEVCGLEQSEIDEMLSCLDSAQPVNSQGSLRAYDSTFDWFSWDTAQLSNYTGI